MSRLQFSDLIQDQDLHQDPDQDPDQDQSLDQDTDQDTDQDLDIDQFQDIDHHLTPEKLLALRIIYLDPNLKTHTHSQTKF
jgi:hypothetical protein